MDGKVRFWGQWKNARTTTSKQVSKNNHHKQKNNNNNDRVIPTMTMTPTDQCV